MNSLVDRLGDQLERIRDRVEALVSISPIVDNQRSFDRFAAQGVILAGMPQYSWAKPNADQLQIQREVLELWNPWVEQMTLLFSEDTKPRQKTITDAIKRIELWIHRDKADHTVPATTAEARQVSSGKFDPLMKALSELNTGSPSVFVVPDTNVLLLHPEIGKYATALGSVEYTVWLVPPVLHELDSHKVNHRNPEVREAARKFSTRLKGWRNQGSLATGVKVEGKAFVRAEGREPDFTKTLSWLQQDIVDDRILATVLELQRRFPSASIRLASSDTNMLTKADAASIPTVDIDCD
jgi:hypothetical protein